eukprot:TRINITY_DN51352_c0_g1_i1.p1 TRINITY_DN51352_c0_g1~~TRINITY_DN51352_c0_g1_i1.p1  ORF type:complete len:371 (+),score=114.84 TRINITY_DN51352_c0_g1_i1:77-1189(+)
MRAALRLLLALAAGGAAGAGLGPTVRLRGGVEMPTVGLGNGGGCHPDPDGTERLSCPSYNVTLSAIGVGYRAFHDALSYCNQAGLGAAVRDAVQLGKLRRSEAFLMSMVPKFLMGYNQTKGAVAASMRQMGVDYLDLVMLHHRAADIADWPRKVCVMRDYPDVPVSEGHALWGPPPCALADPTWQTCQDESWRALLELRDAGTIRAVGVSNWRTENLRRMQRLGQELPAVNQVEAHIGWHDDELIDWAAANGVVIQAATPLGRGMPALVSPGGDPAVSAAAGRLNVTPAQVSLRWLLDRGVAVIAAASSEQYQRENLAVHGFRLNAAEVAQLGLLTPRCRGDPADGLAKCWADPAAMICRWSNGSTFHCP